MSKRIANIRRSQGAHSYYESKINSYVFYSFGETLKIGPPRSNKKFLRTNFSSLL